MERRRQQIISSVFLSLWSHTLNTLRFSADMLEESESEDENLIELETINTIGDEPHRITGYIERTVSGYTAKEFQSHFRIELTVYEELQRVLGPSLSTNQETNTDKQLLPVLWLLATPDSFRSVGDRFDLAKSCLSKYFINVVDNINKISPNIIKWPNPVEKVEAQEAFADFAGLQGCIGAVDGTFIEIKAPRAHAHVYICRKNFYAIQLQAIALPNLKFTDVFTGYPGSVGDRRIILNSPIYKNISNNINQFFDEHEYIIGDKAYPVLPWCIPPFIDRGAMTAQQSAFNIQHAKTRQIIERSFALLFGRYRRLKYLDMNLTKFIPKTILACCTLHNLCLLNEESESIEAMIAEGEAYLRSRQEIMPEENQDGNNTSEGYQRRNLLMNNFHL